MGFYYKGRCSTPTPGSYYINNTMVPFHGTWMWVSGTDTVKIFLATKKVYKDIIPGGYYTDLLVGWHIYKRGNATVETSYANINIVNGSTLMGSNSNDAPDVPFLDPRNHQAHSILHEGRMRRFHAMPWHGYFIWGATAGILMSLYRLLHDEA